MIGGGTRARRRERARRGLRRAAGIAVAVVVVAGGLAACRQEASNGDRERSESAKSAASGSRSSTPPSSGRSARAPGRAPAPTAPSLARAAAARDLRGLGPVVSPRWLVDLGAGPPDPIGVHRGPRLSPDGIAVESSAVGYTVVRPDDGRVVRRRPHQPLAPRLERRPDAVIDWPVENGQRYASVPGAVLRERRQVRAIALDDGIGPTAVDPETGRRIARGQRGPRASVASAAWSPSGFAAVAIRFSSGPSGPSSERRAGAEAAFGDDVVAGFDPDGRLVWAWPVPPPAVDRGDPPGLLATDSAVYVFYDGRWLAALATRPGAATSAAPGAGADSAGE